MPKENKYDINSKVKRIGLFGINFSFIFYTYDEYIEEDVTYTYDELTKKGEQEATNYERSILTQDKKMFSKKVNIDKVANEVIYKVTYIVEENIGSFVETGEN